MTRRTVRTAALAAAVLLCPQIASAEDREPPMMDPDRPVTCVEDTEGKRWRIQCDEETKVCLYAPDAELDTRGRRSGSLERARPCAQSVGGFDRAALEASGYTLVRGRPDAPHGWTRDDRGRVFQVNFDLKRRLYIGGAYAPLKRMGRKVKGQRSSVDFGLLVFESYGGPDDPNRHRLRAVEGEVFLEPFSGELTLLHWDFSRRFLDPLLRITTFFGTPQRHDLHLNLGFWSEAGHLEVHHTEAAESNLWRFGTLQGTLDLWQSPRLGSYARVRTGLGFERLYTEGIDDASAITASTAFELDWVLDPAGFHNVRAELVYETPNYFDPRPSVGRRARRMRARVEYEAIVLAINDQPLSVRLGAGSEKRDDIPGLPDRWSFVADAGLRFSLWAPPRPPE